MSRTVKGHLVTRLCSIVLDILAIGDDLHNPVHDLWSAATHNTHLVCDMVARHAKQLQYLVDVPRVVAHVLLSENRNLKNLQIIIVACDMLTHSFTHTKIDK